MPYVNSTALFSNELICICVKVCARRSACLDTYMMLMSYVNSRPVILRSPKCCVSGYAINVSYRSLIHGIAQALSLLSTSKLARGDYVK